MRCNDSLGLPQTIVVRLTLLHRSPSGGRIAWVTAANVMIFVKQIGIEEVTQRKKNLEQKEWPIHK